MLVNIKVGSSYKYSVGRVSEDKSQIDLAGHDLELVVVNVKTDAVVFSKQVSDMSQDQLFFIATFTPSDTSSIGVGHYVVFNRLSSLSESYAKQEQFELKIEKSYFLLGDRL